MCETKLGPVPDGALDRVTITDFVDELVAALLTRRLYDRKHMRVRGRIAELRDLHKKLIAAQDHRPLVLGTTEGFLLYDDRPLLGASMGAKAFIDRLVARNAGGIEFAREIGDQDVELLLELLEPAARSAAAQADGCPVAKDFPPLLAQPIGCFAHAPRDDRRRERGLCPASLTHAPWIGSTGKETPARAARQVFMPF